MKAVSAILSLLLTFATVGAYGIMLEPGMYEVARKSWASPNVIAFGDVGGGRRNLGVEYVSYENGMTVGFSAFHYGHISNQSSSSGYKCKDNQCYGPYGSVVTILSPTNFTVHDNVVVYNMEKVSSKVCRYETYTRCSKRCELKKHITCKTYNRDGSVANQGTPWWASDSGDSTRHSSGQIAP